MFVQVMYSMSYDMFLDLHSGQKTTLSLAKTPPQAPGCL
jgi:hypothetical protein